MADTGFHFINSNGPKVPKDPALRTLIRKQAMKDVGIARKKRGGYGRVNLRQPPSDARTSVPKGPPESSGNSTDADRHSHVTPDSDSTSSSTPTTDTDATTPDAQLAVTKQMQTWLTDHDSIMPLNGPPATGYERLRMKYHFDVRDLSILTSFNIGKGTMLAISNNPELLTTLLGSQMQSYLQFIPSRYGHKPYLTAVVDCVSAKVHSKLYPRNDVFEDMILRMYAKALAQLQVAVAGDESSLDPDLLCAIQMLSLHEMLEPSRTAEYMHHINGSALVIQRRTPSRFKTEYEKMLFHAHIGPVFSEALMNNTRCYLDQPPWMALYESLIDFETPHLTDRSEVVIRLRMRILGLSSMLPDVTDALDPDSPPGSDADPGQQLTGQLFTLELKARDTHAALLTCLEAYNSHVLRTALSPVPQSELALRREVYGTALETLCIYKRILASFCEAERVALEGEAQVVAARIMELQTQPAPRHSWIYSAQEKGVAAVVLGTREEWERKGDLKEVGGEERWRVGCERWRRFNRWIHREGAPGV